MVWCSMHVINLGVALWVAGGTFMELMDAGNWADELGYECRFRAAYVDFTAWAKEMSIPKLGPEAVYIESSC